MEISQRKQNGIAIVELKGKLDTLACPELEKKLCDIITETECRFLVDFSQLDFISSSGLRVLLIVAKQLKCANGKIVLCGLKKNIKEVFDIAGFSQLFKIFPSQAEAANELQ